MALRAWLCECLGESIPSSGNSPCKGSEASARGQYEGYRGGQWAGAEWARERVVGDQVRKVVRPRLHRTF